MRVVGLDLSLSSTGVAHLTGGETNTCAIKSHFDGVERLTDLRDRIAGIVFRPAHARLVLIEGYAYGMRRGASNAHSLGELGGVVRVDLHENEVPVLVVPPATVKKYATGKGNASKTEVLSAAVHRAGREFTTNDEADAWWLLQIGCVLLELAHIQMPGDNRAALSKLTVPDLGVHV